MQVGIAGVLLKMGKLDKEATDCRVTPRSPGPKRSHSDSVSVRNGRGGGVGSPTGNCQEDWTGPDDNFYPSRPVTF